MLIRKNKDNGRGSIFLCLLLLAMSTTYAQQQFYLTGRIETHVRSSDEEIQSSCNEKDVWYCSEHDLPSTLDKMNIHHIDRVAQKSDSFEISLPPMIHLYGPPHFAVGQGELILQDDSDLSLLRFTSGKNFNFKSQIHLPDTTDAMQFEFIGPDRLLIGSYYNHHPADKKKDVSLTLYDTKRDKVIRNICPDVSSIAFSHLFNNYIDAGSNRIAVADAGSNKVYLFDLNLDCSDTVLIPSTVIDAIIATDTIPFETHTDKVNPKVLIEKLKSYSNSISRIEGVYLLGTSQLYISVIPERKYNTEREVWCYDFIRHLFIGHERVSESNQFCSTLKFPALSDYRMETSGRSLIICRDDNYLKHLCQSEKEFESERNLYYTKHEPYYDFLYYELLPKP